MPSPVQRTLPQKKRSLIGGWCFADHYGPDDVSRTGGMDVESWDGSPWGGESDDGGCWHLPLGDVDKRDVGVAWRAIMVGVAGFGAPERFDVLGGQLWCSLVRLRAVLVRWRRCGV